AVFALLLAAGVAVAAAAALRPGRRPAADASPAFLFLSPNTDANLTPADARRRLRSPEHQRFRRLAEGLAADAGARGHQARDALGDWADGAENSILVELPHPPAAAALRRAAVRFGLLANQREVLAFAPGDGPDVVWQVEAPEPDPAALRQALDRCGIPCRTLVPTAAGWRVVVCDRGRRLGENLGRLGRAYGTAVRATPGTGDWIGAETREQARHLFRQLLRGGEAAPACLPRFGPSGTVIAPHPPGDGYPDGGGRPE
ncbi:MAG TPA: hypothetical protein VFA26_17515, partial [Gemmataceae bacterium]|nr:hypothetical protein [Gemmataceae bacterium]